MSLCVGGAEQWGARANLGALGPVVGQLPPAATRVDRGDLALVRSAVFDAPVALFMVFTPDGDDVVASLVTSEELSDPVWMPDGARAEALYAYFDEHAAELTAASQAADRPAPQRIGRAVASACLHREAALGAEAVALLGPGSF